MLGSSRQRVIGSSCRRVLGSGASRTVPVVSKAIGVALAKIAAKVMVGETLSKQGFVKQRVPNYFSVKEAVFPFIKFPGSDPILGPEMKSTGEVMGVDRDFAGALTKALLAANLNLPKKMGVLLSSADQNNAEALDLVRDLGP